MINFYTLSSLMVLLSSSGCIKWSIKSMILFSESTVILSTGLRYIQIKRYLNLLAISAHIQQQTELMAFY